MIRNNFMGRLPKPGWTMYVQYRVGGGAASNVAKGRINSFAFLNMEVGKCVSSPLDTKIIAAVRDSLKCENTTPSISGKDAPSVEEIKNMVKYNNGAQERCVTLKDYINRIMMMPPRYGCPFRIGAIEENNKIMIYLLGINNDGKLSSDMPAQLLRNIENYLSMYRTINDFVEIKRDFNSETMSLGTISATKSGLCELRMLNKFGSYKISIEIPNDLRDMPLHSKSWKE
jgi:hypothetical protein